MRFFFFLIEFLWFGCTCAFWARSFSSFVLHITCSYAFLYKDTAAVANKDYTTLARDWRIVNIPEEDSKAIDIATLFSRILEHVYDPLEPYLPTPADSTAPIRAAVGSSQQGSFQDLPLNVRVADAVQFGLYLKFFIIRGENEVSVGTTSNIRNAAEVEFSI